MRETERQTVKKFNDACSVMGEHFEEYLIIGIKKGTKERYWRASSPTWGVGAAMRFIHHVAHVDQIETERGCD